jgi:SAM-dependent methyltransferase
MKAKYLIKGFFKSIPGIEHIYNFHPNTGGTNDARYCYSVWLRHLVRAYENGMTSVPGKIAELGPGDSLGIGISALITGAQKYYALDIVKYCNAEKNLKIFEELVTLFRNRVSIPVDAEFPNMRPPLASYEFPHHILTGPSMEIMLNESRLEKIRDSIRKMDLDDKTGGERMICYRVPWNDDKVIELGSMDMIISQAVLQHIDGLEETYKAMHKWLRPGGMMSHSIDLKSMGSSDSWDGHWAYSDAQWKIVRGRKSYLINREPYSMHIKYLKDNGFKIVADIKSISASTMHPRTKLAKKYRNMPEEDLAISGTFIQAIK